MWDFPEASLRHFTFMLDGLVETFEQLRGIGALPVLVEGEWAREMRRLSEQASEMVLDQGYLRLHKAAYAELAKTVDCGYSRSRERPWSR
jgi:deoxyribodipyrimidine photo-lyase